MKISILLGIIAILLSTFQSQAREYKKWNKRMIQADSIMKIGDYYTAAEYYAKMVEADPNHSEVKAKYGAALFMARNYLQAKSVLQPLATDKKNTAFLANYYYGLLLMQEYEYKLAIKQFDIFRTKYRGSDGTPLKTKCRFYKNSCKYAMKAVADTQNVIITHVDNLNSNFSDFSPRQLGDSLLMFSTIKSDSIFTEREASKPQYLSQIKLAKKTDDGWAVPKDHFIPLQTSDYHVSNGVFSMDGTRFYYSRCEEKRTVLCQIMVSYKNDSTGVWETPEPVENINLEGYSSSQPEIGLGNKGEEILYFVSNRPLGAGGHDIWFSTLKDSIHQKPRNAGRKINTALDEFSPHFNKALKSLFFSSEGLPGFGGFDVFQTSGAGTQWRKPVNLGFGFNTGLDELYYSLNDDRETGYFVSNRDDALSPAHQNCCDDMYHVQWLRSGHRVAGFAFEEKDSVNALDSIIVELFLIDTASGTAQTIAQDTAFATSEYEFYVEPGKRYKLSASRSGYYSEDVVFNTEKTRKLDSITMPLFLSELAVNQIYTLDDLLYDFGTSELNDQSQMTLNRLITIMFDTPTLRIEVSSHTDNTGSDVYNQKLSQKRAQAVVDLIILAGIDEDRLVAKGYGESQPKEPNEHPDGTDNPQGRAANRRAEFKVLAF